MKKIKVLSLFDGMSCGSLALRKAGIPVGKYFASEIEKAPIKVAAFNNPGILHIGDVCNVDPDDFRNIDLVIAGSPCQSLSVAGNIGGIMTNDGQIVDSLGKYLFLKDVMGYSYDDTSERFFTTSSLFWEFIRIYRTIQKYNPEVKFLLENVVNKEWGRLITNELGVNPIQINSSMVSAQNRDRYYWTNIDYKPIEYNGYNLVEIIPDAISGAGSRGVPQKNWVKTPENPKKHKQKLTVRKDGLANCLTASGGKICRKYKSTSGEIKDITITQAEMLQTVPVGYTDVPGVSESQRFKMLGNGWTIDVIAHFFEGMKTQTPLIDRVVTMVKTIPNDFDLGGEVRNLINQTI